MLCSLLTDVYFGSGSQDGFAHHHDVRVQNHHVGTVNGHTQVRSNELSGWSTNIFLLFEQSASVASYIFVLLPVEMI